ncbi:phosphoadenylyl-sulfate reductase [Peribacillus deserti]|uniref:Adenosine 5'-phosphosulfate reductase n=1 Tax=Peribacillus deserti TaxID=673318 RepID=A0A2N5M398_9BACI|nr:phosphoadenylyl-sulfate reductase [Peribacillus deserti]PLT28841.1 phosphoadenylyl-sulfate reductase [Peribacillus deserti]
MITYETWADGASRELEGKDYFDVLKWAYNQYGDEIVYACSFGAEGIVLIDLISKVNKNARVIFLDTELHFQETYDLIDKMKAKYPLLTIDLVKPKLSLEQQEERHGKELWKHNSNQCCHMRKIEPLAEQLSGMKAWISGLRREQSLTRKHVEYINKDEKFKLIKICPLIHWTWDDVWTYIKLNQLPYNELHDQNYPSIGCRMCTVPVTDGSNSRGGRWMNSEKTECGLHTSN